MVKIEPFDFDRNWPKMCDLFQRVFRKTVSKDYCDWKFSYNYGGQAVALGAWSDERLVGFIGLWPYPVSIQGNLLTASQTGDVMVDEAFRHRGIFKALGERLYFDEMVHRGWLFYYGAPGANSYRGYVSKLRAQLVFNLSYWIKFRPLIMIRNKISPSVTKRMNADVIYNYKDFQVSTVQGFDQRFDALWEETKGNYRLCVARNSGYLNWRYLQHPLFKHHILACQKGGWLQGYAVIRGENLSELWAVPCEDVYRALLLGAELFWKKSRLGQGHAWFNGDPLIAQALRRSGWIEYRYKPRPLGLYPVQPLICYPNPNRPEARIALDGDAWRFSMGDVDCM